MRSSWYGWRMWIIISLAHSVGCDGATLHTDDGPAHARAGSSQPNTSAPRDADGGASDDTSIEREGPGTEPCALIGAWDYGQLLHLSDTVHHTPLTLIEEFPDESGGYACGESGGSLWCDSPCLYDDVDGVRVTGYLGQTLIWGGVATEDSVCFMTGGSYGMEIHRASLDSDLCELSGTVTGHGGSWDWEAVPASSDDDPS